MYIPLSIHLCETDVSALLSFANDVHVYTLSAAANMVHKKAVICRL